MSNNTTTMVKDEGAKKANDQYNTSDSDSSSYDSDSSKSTRSSTSSSTNSSTNSSEFVEKKSTTNPSNDQNDPEEEDFQPLKYEDVRINLRVMADLKEGEKVMIVAGKYMQVDQRYIQGIRRYWSSDSRRRTLDFISHIIEWAQRYCREAVNNVNNNHLKQVNLERLLDMQSLLNASLTGLGRMSTTYGDDKLNLATIENFRSTVKTFCDQDLKKAIDADKAK